MRTCLLWLVLACASAPLPALERLLTEDQALRAAFPQALTFSVAVHPLEPAQATWLRQQRHRRPNAEQFRWARALDAHGRWLGSALIDAELGKHQAIDYLVAMGPDGRVRDVELLVYREAYGGGVRSEKFRSQFKGVSQGAALELGRDVDAVAGATISSRTFADGVAKALRLFQDLERREGKP